MTGIDPAVALGLRGALATLRASPERVRRALDAVRGGRTPEARRAAALEAGMDFPSLALAGELASRLEAEREELVLAATDADEERAHARSLAEELLEPRVFRALRHVFPHSFRAPALDAWERYRAHLRGLMDRPVWPGRDVSLRQLFVAPECVRYDWKGARGRSPAVVEALPDDPVEWLARALKGTLLQPTLLLGDAGFGKSTLATAIAAELADDDEVFPLLVPAGALEPGVDAYTALGGALARAGFPGLLQGAPWIDAPVLILDGLGDGASERPVAAVLEAVEHALGRGALRSALVTARPEVIDEASREGGLEFHIEPFDDARAREWARRWNQATGKGFDVEPFLQAPEDEDPGSEDESPLQFARQPLTLLMIAEMASEGHSLRGTVRLRDRAAVYRELVTWRCRRVADGASAGELRRELRRAARLLHERRASDGRRRDEGVEPSALPSWHRVASNAGGEGELFPLVHQGGAYRFFHDSFADYLLAESLSLEGARLVMKAHDVDGSPVAALDPPELAARWLRLFGTFDMTAGVDQFLAVMLPAWEGFAKGHRRHPRRAVMEWVGAVSDVYRVLLAYGATGQPGLAYARALRAVLLLATPGAPRAERFAPERVAPGAFPDVARLLARADVAWWPSFHDRITLAGCSWRGCPLQGIDLSELDLTGADLRDADLRGANLNRATLDRADLSHARLDGADLQGASLKGALLVGTSLRGVELPEERRAEAVFTREGDDTP